MLLWISIVLFALMIGFGYLCSFYDVMICTVIFVYAILLFLLSFRHMETSCIALKWEDYFITLLLTICMCLFSSFFASLSFSLFAYFYLSCFIAYINFACGKRFASLFETIDKSSKNGTI